MTIVILLAAIIIPILGLMLTRTQATSSSNAVSFDITLSTNNVTWTYDVDNVVIDTTPMGGGNHVGAIRIVYPRDATWAAPTAVPTNGTSQGTVNSGRCGSGVACKMTQYTISGSANNLAEITTFINNIRLTAPKALRGEINITLMPESMVSWIDNDGYKHFYERKNAPAAVSWTGAYNFAQQQTFHGLTGYLMSMTEKAEADIIKQYTTSIGTDAVGYTAGIRFRQNDTAHSKVDGTVGYGSDTRVMPNLPTGGTASTIQGITSTGAPYGFICTRIGTSDQGCSVQVAKVPAGTTCPTAAAYDTEWYWVNPVDNGVPFFMGRAGGTNTNAECKDHPINQGELVSFWQGEQPQGGEPIMAYQSASGSSFGWHDYTNNAGAAVYVEYSEGWADRGGGIYIATESYGATDMPTDIVISHLRNGTNETLAANTFAPNSGLNDLGTLFFCSVTNGGATITGYTFFNSNCLEDGSPYPSIKNVSYYYTHDSIANPVPFQIQRTSSGGNYVYKFINNGAAVDAFGLIRQVVITLPAGLTFSATAQAGFSYGISGNTVTITINNGAPPENGVNPSDVLNYLLNNVSLTASGLTNITGNVTVQVADFASTPSTGDSGRTSTTAAIPQPITVNYFRLGQTTPLQPTVELIGLIGETYVVSAAPAITNYTFNSSVPNVGTTLTYSNTPQTLTYFYTYDLGIPVNFDLGGMTSLVTINNQTVDSGNYAIRPPIDPRVLGQKFTGWYTASDLVTLFDFESTPITDPITIYAGFTPIGQQTVIFHDSDGPAGVAFIPASPSTIPSVAYNSTISAPTPPQIEGFSFVSWNTAQMTNATTCAGAAFNFANNYVTSETGTFDLYACYAQQSNVIVYFRATGTPATVQVLPSPTSRSVVFNGMTTAPDISPISEGYSFTSWNTDPMSGTTCGGSAFNFGSTRITAAITNLYACFTAQPDIRLSFDRGAAADSIIGNWPNGIPGIPYNSSFGAFEPPDEPFSEAAFFDHWCLDQGAGSATYCTRAEAFDFSARQTSNVTLVANWREERVVVDFVTPSGGLTSGGNSVAIHGAGFIGFDQNSYIQNGLFSQLDGIYNSSGGHATSLSTWYNIKNASGAPNFTLTNSPTIGDRYISFNGTNQSARSASAMTVLPNNAGTIEMYHRLNAVGLASAVLYEHSATSASNNGGIALARNSSAVGTFATNTCFRTVRGASNSNATWACPNNTNWTTYSNVWSRATGSPTTNITVPYIDSTLITPTANTTVAANALSSTFFLASRNATSNWANISIGSLRMYNRQLSAQEIRCNYLIDMARFQNKVVDITECNDLTYPITPHTINVTLGGNTCTVTSFTNSVINCTVPASTLGTPDQSGQVDVAVASGDSNDDLVNGYTYLAPLTITDITPNQGSINGGTNITIKGTGFLVAGTTVRIGTRLCQSVAVVDTATITCVVPSSTLPAPGTGQVNVSVVVSGETATAVNGFTYILDFITFGSSLDGPLRMHGFPSASGTAVMDYMDLIVSTSAGGYTISIKADNPNMVCQDNSSYILAPLSASGNLANERWGYGIAEIDTGYEPYHILPPVAWNPVTTTNTAIITQYSSATNANHYVYFGAKLSTAQPACVYSGTVTFTASVGVDDP